MLRGTCCADFRPLQRIRTENASSSVIENEIYFSVTFRIDGQNGRHIVRRKFFALLFSPLEVPLHHTHSPDDMTLPVRMAFLSNFHNHTYLGRTAI